MSYFANLKAEIESYACFNDDQFLKELGRIETRTLKQLNLLIEDPEFPDDVRKELQWCMCATHTVTPPGDTPNRREINYAEKYHESKIINAIEVILRNLEERRVESRFGILDTNVSGMLMRRWEWEQANTPENIA